MSETPDYSPSHPLYATTQYYRVLRGRSTRQLAPGTGKPALRTKWYYEPRDYEGDVLWSPPYPTQHAALVAAKRELANTPTEEPPHVENRSVLDQSQEHHVCP